jgi:hypothetical protein
MERAEKGGHMNRLESLFQAAGLRVGSNGEIQSQEFIKAVLPSIPWLASIVLAAAKKVF